MKIVHVVGARPNFIKAAPVYSAAAKHGFSQKIVHTGQHYKKDMSRVFFEQLELPKPDINLRVGSGSHAEQTAKIMLRFEKAVSKTRPDWVVVYGDVNSTLAAALVCAKLFIPVAHVEAGLRSFDRRMPEEINRLLTDQIADRLFTHSKDANTNLRREGVSEEKIKFVGNVMVDTLVKLLPLAKKSGRSKYVAGYKNYALVTLHRPSNVDDKIVLTKILKALGRISCKLPIIFPVHPRTQKRLACLVGLKKFSYLPRTMQLVRGLHFLKSLGYLEFLNLESKATVVITDSGGIQEETTFLGVPCLTLRKNTERPITVTLGTNLVVGSDYKRLEKEVDNILSGRVKKGKIPPLWDGRTAERIIKVLKQVIDD